MDDSRSASIPGSETPPFPPPPLIAGGTGASGAGVPPSLTQPPFRFPTAGASSGGGAPPPRRGGGLWVWGLLALGLVGLLVVGGLVWVAGSLGGGSLPAFSGGGVSGGDHLHEVVLETASTRDKIAVIELQGVISSDPIDYEGTTVVTHVKDQLERAAADDHVKALLLKIDSPGGEVLASDEIYKLLADFQAEQDKPVVATMGTVAASGGYYVAAPCRWIVANELTITGSIGVIMHSYNWRGLMDKVGVRPQVFKSGELKDMLSPDKREEDITGEERRIVQDLVNETFDRFKGVVEEGRGLALAQNEDNSGDESDHGRKLSGNWQDYADGRLLSGKEAWRLGFVDELGDFATAFQRARKLAGLKEARLVQYLRPASFGSMFRLFGKTEAGRVTLDLGVPFPKVRAGTVLPRPQFGALMGVHRDRTGTALADGGRMIPPGAWRAQRGQWGVGKAGRHLARPTPVSCGVHPTAAGWGAWWGWATGRPGWVRACGCLDRGG